MIYLDSAATTFQKPPAVGRAMTEALASMSSPGRGGHPLAMRAADTAFRCRTELAELFGLDGPEGVAFTLNATHALNIAIKSLVPPGGRVVISGYEHNAVTRPLTALKAKVSVAGGPLFDQEAAIRAFDELIVPGVDAVICNHVSNVFGFVQPVEKVAALCRSRGVPLIVDASQSAGILPINMKSLGAAYIAMPGHKGLYGPQGTGVLMPLTKVHPGDEIVVRSGNMIPLDGTVIEGEAMVNQAALTGESMPVRKTIGATVYAGTVVEEGECVLTTRAEGGANRYDKIVAMIEESEKLKSSTENRALALADRLVPWCLGATVVTYALTRNATRAISCLMVDFSCALKLSMPLAVLSAMRECGASHITVKGGKYLETLSKADTIVFDKTGTLTRATPKVVKVVPFSGCSESEVLQLAACLEEHFPHSMANAVVREAKERGISHEEMHSEVEYIVAHGIASRVSGERVVIGSHHFVFEDEHCTIPEDEREKFDNLEPEYSHLYLAASGRLAGVICIADPLRPEASRVLRALRGLGITNTVMMTGDSERTAAAIAKQVGVDQFFAEVLPEDKAAFVQKAKSEGHTVVMIGDGINDSPALSAADVGIAINSGAAIAREIADVTIKADSLEELVILKTIANSLQRRVSANYHFVLTFNSALIALGAMGILQPASSAMLHNLSTIGISLKSMTNLIPEEKAQKALAEKN